MALGARHATSVPRKRQIQVYFIISSLTLVFLTVFWSKFSQDSLNIRSTAPAKTKCPSCNFIPLNNPTSTRRDVVLAAALTELKRVEYFLRTLRATGTNARVILFLNSNATLTEGWRSFFAACNIEPVVVPPGNPFIDNTPKLSRYYYEEQWLSENINDVDRILHTDTFDVIFQSDPFIPSISKDKLYFTYEPVSIQNSLWTASWMNQCYSREELAPTLKQNTSCSGVTAGGSKPFLTYLRALITTPKWRECFGHSLDQAHHNYLLHTGKFAELGLQIEAFGCDSPYLTMHFCCKTYKCAMNENGFIEGPNPSVVPVLVHQYNRWKNKTNSLKTTCPSPKKGPIELTRDVAPAPLQSLPPLVTDFPKMTMQLPKY